MRTYVELTNRLKTFLCLLKRENSFQQFPNSYSNKETSHRPQQQHKQHLQFVTVIVVYIVTVTPTETAVTTTTMHEGRGGSDFFFMRGGSAPRSKPQPVYNMLYSILEFSTFSLEIGTSFA